MFGDEQRVYFELFTDIVVYEIDENGNSTRRDWLDLREYCRLLENRLKNPSVTLNGEVYAFDDDARNSVSIDATINNIGTLTYLKIFQRRRQTSPPLVEFRLTRFGSALSRLREKKSLWGKFLYRTLFFLIGAYIKAHKFWKIIAFFAACMAVVNSAKFLNLAFSEISTGWSILVGVSGIIISIYIWRIFDK